MSPGPCSLGSDGCLVTALAGGLSNFAIDLDPGQLNDKLVVGGGYMDDSQLDWGRLPDILPGVKLYRRMRTTVHPGENEGEELYDVAMGRMAQAVDNGMIVLVHVDAIGHDDWPDHFCLLHPRWFIMDPAYGDIQHITVRYGTLDKAIKGYAIVTGSPVDFPEGGDPRSGGTVGKLLKGLDEPAILKQMAKESIDLLMSPKI